jgi:membrane associated rhomboid family serine protease
VFVPIHDDNPLKSISLQWVTFAIILANVAVFAFIASGQVTERAALSFAVVPMELLDEGVRGAGTYMHKYNYIDVRERWTLLSYMFMHGDLMHLASNMIFLWVFGDNVEDALGHVRFVVFYLLCGIGAALFHAAAMPHSEIPLIGASGAVAGCIGAYLLLHPRVRVWVLAFRVIPLRVTAAFALGLWIAMQFVMPFLTNAPIAWWAHVGGVVTGMVLVLVLRRRGVPLLG